MTPSHPSNASACTTLSSKPNLNVTNFRSRTLAHQRIWRFSRTTAWRYVKQVMAVAGITGTPAMPKGLRHGFGVRAFQSNVPPHLVQRWLGHASLRTTGIYGDVLGPEERAFAIRMWSD